MAEENNPGFEYWRETLNSARLIVAPMVDASELAWRMLSRRYGAELCYTPMLHSHVFVKDARYRKDNLESCLEDRPLIVQFCANDPDVFVKACRLAGPFCDGIDLNLGCPQTIARKGHYGAFLMDEWDLIKEMISRAKREAGVHISAKIRIFPELDKTIRYAQMLESSGISLLTVHGRTRDQKGALTGLANWDFIKAVRESVKIPVFANGNIQCLEDVERCIKYTGVQGVMTAEGNLHNPALFAGLAPPVCQMALEYLTLVKKFPCPISYARGHLFKLLHHAFNMPENFEIRYRMSKAPFIDVMIEVIKELKGKLEDYVQGKKSWHSNENETPSLPLPPWICQPYVRMPAEEHLKKLAETRERAKEKKLNRPQGNEGTNGQQSLSRKKLKRLEKNPYKKFKTEPEPYEKCSCRNPRGSRCSFLLCRTCCKFKCHLEELACPGHKIKAKTSDKVETQSSVEKVDSLSPSGKVETHSSSEKVETQTSSEKVKSPSSSEMVESHSSSEKVENSSSSEKVESHSSSEKVENSSSLENVEISSAAEKVEIQPS